ncbi:translation initiation factor 3 [Escherichia phage EJP2]|nr:translation initiation factor 3 [Escherichia phage EJP2]
MKSIIANNEITATSVRLVTEGSSEVLAIDKALAKARNEGLDLIQVTEHDVPVVKIADLNKFKYEQKQAEKAAQKKQRANIIQTKEIQFASNTQENDLAVKAKNARKFIEEGKQVHIVMKAAGRLGTQTDSNIETLGAFVERLGENVEFVQKVEVQGKNITCTVKAK